MLEENIIHGIDSSKQEFPEYLVQFESKFIGRKDFSEVALLQKTGLSQIKNSGKILLLGMQINKQM